MSVSLSDSLLDLNCSATPNAAVSNRAEGGNADGNSRRSGVDDEGAVGGANNNAINEGASGSSNNRNGSAIAGPSRTFVPIYMEVDEDYREFCEQFGFEVSEECEMC